SVVAGAADDTALAVDIDPDHATVLHELHARSAAAVQFRAEIIGAAHERQDFALELRERHRPALLRVLESTVGIAGVRIRKRWCAAYAGHNGGDEEKDTAHGQIRDSLGPLSIMQH